MTGTMKNSNAKRTGLLLRVIFMAILCGAIHAFNTPSNTHRPAIMPSARISRGCGSSTTLFPGRISISMSAHEGQSDNGNVSVECVHDIPFSPLVLIRLDLTASLPRFRYPGGNS